MTVSRMTGLICSSQRHWPFGCGFSGQFIRPGVVTHGIRIAMLSIIFLGPGTLFGRLRQYKRIKLDRHHRPTKRVWRPSFIRTFGAGRSTREQ